MSDDLKFRPSDRRLAANTLGVLRRLDEEAQEERLAALFAHLREQHANAAGRRCGTKHGCTESVRASHGTLPRWF